MKKIAFIGAKGGIGKTTSAMLTAAALTNQGQTVAVIDTDPQASASTWAQLAAQAGPPLSFSVLQAGANFASKIPRELDWAFLDTPPGNEEIIRKALKWADLAILPTRPGALDLLQLQPTLAAAAQTPVAAAVLITQARAGVIETDQTLEELKGVNTFTFNTVVPLRAHTGRLALVHPSVRALEMSGYADVAQELMEAFK